MKTLNKTTAKELERMNVWFLRSNKGLSWRKVQMALGLSDGTLNAYKAQENRPDVPHKVELVK